MNEQITPQEQSPYAAPQPPANGAPQPQPNGALAPAQKEKNTIGLVALIVAAVGFIFACIPGALIVGWIALPIAFILSIVGLCLPRKKKLFPLIGLIVSIVGTIVGFIVFFAVVANAVDDAVNEAFGGGDTSIEAPAEDKAEELPGETAPDKGASRDNPVAIGSVITQGDWEVTVNSVDLDATEELLAEDLYNEEPEEGMAFAMVNLTAKYVGSDNEGASPWVSMSYVTADGNTVEEYDYFISTPEEFDVAETLYEGASTTGNMAFQVPADTAGDGVLAVEPTILGDKVFVAVK